jgi:hypothetical protein
MSAKRQILLTAVTMFALCLPAWADQAAPLSALAQMPIREVTVFKDGHALVLHTGKMPTDTSGNVVLDYLPTPLLGAFWPYSADKNAQLQAVTAGQRRVRIERTALSLREILEANIGAEVTITEISNQSYPATILGLPQRSGEELEATSPPNTGPQLPTKGELVLLKTQLGVKAVRVDAIRDVTITGEVHPKAAAEEFRNLLTLKLQWKDKPADAAEVGLMYVQKGLRWIPSYKVDIDGEGKATVKFQATLVNELADMDDVTAHLVIGVPSFAFQDTTDPMALQQLVAQIESRFRGGAYAMGRAIMSQTVAPMVERDAVSGGRPPTDLGPEVAGGERHEDLFVFDVQHMTLKKGQRMVLPVAEYVLPYRDVFTLDVPFTPPLELWGDMINYLRGRVGEGTEVNLIRAMYAPKVQHQIRLTNSAKAPLTTAPAMILRQGRLLAQGIMLYTPIGAESDLTITQAVDITVAKSDKETARTPNAATWDGSPYARIDLVGSLKLTNRRDKKVQVEVTRYVLGNATQAGQDGKVEMVNVFEDPSFLPARSAGGLSWDWWWQWHNWPNWWYHFNGVGKISWKVDLAPGDSTELNYTWNYYWR